MAISRMEPMLPEDRKHRLSDLATELVRRSSSFGGRLHPELQAGLGDLVRAMNCYYSNFIEGHNTHPVDIERAVRGDYDKDPKKRELQQEAFAHIKVQRLIDRGEFKAPVFSVEFIKWIHFEFCRDLPEEFLFVEDPATKERIRVVPGQFRERHVQVGHHIAPPPEELEAFMARFVEVYGGKGLSKIQQIVGVAAAHHRLLWIHPFLDGNGRVTRLLSHAMLRELNVGSELWAVSRGLARNVENYKSLLMEADGDRRGDLDGRGHLTLLGLERFCEFFLSTCIDQVEFMESLVEPGELLRRIEIWSEEEVRAGRLKKGSFALLREAILAGSYARGRAAAVTGYKERQAGTVLNDLVSRGLLVSPTSRSPVRLGFPNEVVERWLPMLFPAGKSEVGGSKASKASKKL